MTITSLPLSELEGLARVVVRLEINLPESYHRTNGQFVVWTKRWREDGLVDDEYRGVRLSTQCQASGRVLPVGLDGSGQGGQLVWR